MRIVGDIAHPRLKITIFKNDGKFSLKFESGLLEQIYKFRDDDRLATADDVKKVVDASFIEKMEDLLRGMYERGEITLVSGIYDTETGKVAFINE